MTTSQPVTPSLSDPDVPTMLLVVREPQAISYAQGCRVPRQTIAYGHDGHTLVPRK